MATAFNPFSEAPQSLCNLEILLAASTWIIAAVLASMLPRVVSASFSSQSHWGAQRRGQHLAEPIHGDQCIDSLLSFVIDDAGFVNIYLFCMLMWLDHFGNTRS